MSSSDITSHHDGHGLNESIDIIKGAPGPGGASYYYDFFVESNGRDFEGGFLQFQKGPRNQAGSRPGVTELAVLAVIRDRLESFQAGEFACEENAKALEHIKAAMGLMKERADNRAKRGVLGTDKP